MSLPATQRSGRHYRICKQDWLDPADTAFAKTHGGRWNPPGEFGALYLNATIRVAAAQARHQHAGRAIGLFDLRPDRRPELATIDVPKLHVLDAVTSAADWEIARSAYAEPLAGVAELSAAEVRATGAVGEELAVFDTVALHVAKREPFAAWYPDPAP